MSNRAIPKLLVGMIAIGIGTTAGLATFASSVSRTSEVSKPPSGRGLEQPWWAGITIAYGDQNDAPVKTYVVSADLLFDTDSATISPAGRAQLLRLANRDLTRARVIVIAGATDGRGTREHNLDLSQQRADAAKAVLLAGGVEASVIRIEAWADDHPRCDEQSPDIASAQACNRRVEITVTK